MSLATGRVLTPDGEHLLGYFEYDGTSDVALTRIASDKPDLDRTWRSESDENEAACDCGGAPSAVLLRAHYADGV